LFGILVAPVVVMMKILARQDENQLKRPLGIHFDTHFQSLRVGVGVVDQFL
jgi:hypothetical protein